MVSQCISHEKLPPKGQFGQIRVSSNIAQIELNMFQQHINTHSPFSKWYILLLYCISGYITS